MASLVPFEQVEVFFDGIFTDPMLNHPEGLAFDKDGDLWCGGESGEIFRIDKEGKRIELVASTGGFCLGMAFDRKGNLYVCDLKKAAVFRFHPSTGELTLFAGGTPDVPMTPNFPVVDHERNCLYVSNSVNDAPGIWRFDLDTGSGFMWYDRPLGFGNGMALAPDGNTLYVAETFARRISRIPILADGRPGEKEVVAHVDALPDGLAVDEHGRIYVSCYEPSQVLCINENRTVETVVRDEEAHTLCHPTNCAFSGDNLYTANLGRWHITKIPVGVRGKSLL